MSFILQQYSCTAKPRVYTNLCKQRGSIYNKKLKALIKLVKNNINLVILKCYDKVITSRHHVKSYVHYIYSMSLANAKMPML